MSGQVNHDVAVVGAGLAGLAATSALARAGASVVLVERKSFVGGRAYSYPHPALQEEIDSQHVIVGCCTNFRQLCQVSGLSEEIRWYDGYDFMEPGGRVSRIAPSWLPAPAHTAPSFLRAPMLSFADKVAISRGLMTFLRGYSRDDNQSVAAWLKQTRQTEQAIRHFWSPIVISALNDSLERCSMRYAGQIFYESFLKSPEGSRLGIPALPLSEFFGRIVDDAGRQGALLRGKSGLQGIERSGELWRLRLADGGEISARQVVLALPFDQLSKILPAGLFAQLLPEGTAPFLHSPITTVHLWYDREITSHDHAVLLDSPIEWLFHKSRIRRWSAERGSYVELTTSASHAQLKQSREEILSTALGELQKFFPAAKTAVLRKSGVLKEAKATFSVLPGMDARRPAQKTCVEHLYLAGDWTRTGWPSTMEGAVRSGYLAAEAVAADAGSAESFLQTDLRGSGLMPLLAR